MKRFYSFLLIFLLTVAFSSADSIINDIDHFSKLFPREEGSLYEKETISLIKQRLDELKITNRQVDFSETEGYHSFSSYIEADIEGKSNQTLITIIPVNESSYGIASALHLTGHFRDVSPELSLKFVFLGAEEDSSRLMGTRNFIEHFYPEAHSAFIYMNFETAPSSIKIITGADGYCSPFSLFTTTAESLRNAGIQYSYSNTETILYRLSAAGTESRIGAYLSENYPAIELTTEKTTDDNSAVISSESITRFYENILREYSDGIPTEWDRNYIFGLNEQAYLAIYLVLIVLLMVYPIFKRRHFGWYMKTLIKNIWVIPLLFISVFGILSLTSLILNNLFNFINFPELWRYKSVGVLLLKITLAMLMYSLAFKLINKLPFSKRGSFYSISSIVFLVVVVFVLTAVDLTISFFAIWPLCFIFLFTVFRKPVLKFLMLLISSVWLFFSLVEIFALPSFKVIKLITLSPVQGDLLSAVVMLPYILAAIRLDMLSPPSKKITRFVPLILAAVSAGLLAYVLLFSPFSSSNPQPVEVKEIINDSAETRDLIIDSPAALEDSLTEELTERFLSPPEENELMKVDVETRAFLNRKIINTRIDMSEMPREVRVVLPSNSPVTLFESSFPAEWLPSSNELAVYIGRNPEMPLNFSLTLNKNAEINFHIEADYPETTRITEIDGKTYLIRKSTTLTKNYKYED